MSAFGGYMNPGLRETPTRKFANTSALGLFLLSLTTWVLGLCLVNARGVMAPLILVGLLVFAGVGLVLVGMWEVAVENTFGYVVFGSYGVFFLSLASIFMDETFHIQSAYMELDPTGAMLNNAIGLYLSGWVILTTLLVMCTLRSTFPLFITFVGLDVLFMLLTAGYMSGSASVMKGAGAVALFVGIMGFYNSFAGVATYENSWVNLKPLFMPGAQRPPPEDASDATRA